jgi:hypothetical protein
MDELFDTTKLFTLSGNQKYTWKEFKAPELKGRLILKEISRPTTDELYERKQTKRGGQL